MSFYLIEKIEKNINLIIDIEDECILEKVSDSYLTKTEKDPVFFLIQNNKIPKIMTSKLFKFIIDNKYWELFLELDYNKFDIHIDDDIAIIKSSINGIIDVVKFLFQNGANIHVRDDFPLKCSSRKGHIEVVKFLIENGVNMN